MGKNKVNWGLAKSSWFKITTDENGNDIYGVPTPFVGNRQINFDPAGDLVKVYADGTVIFVGKQNSGYSGSMEQTSTDDDFAEWAFGESKDKNNVQYEIKEPPVNRFGLIWEWIQDAKNTRHIMYNVTASRPSMNATTAGDNDSKTAQNRTINLNAIPREDGIVKASTRYDVADAVYNNWFNAAYVPAETDAFAVTITVTDGTDPITNALVVLGNGAMAATNANGQAIFYLVNGTYDIMVSDGGAHTAVADTVTVSSADVAKTITMTAA